MDKIAQRRGLLDKLREKTDFSGKSLEERSPEFAELLENLREVDDHIREEARHLKDYVKAAKTSFNRREYMQAVFYLGQFHDRVEAIQNKLNGLESAVDMKHHSFLFGDDMDPEQKKYLVEHLSQKMEKNRKPVKKAELENASLEKEAGIADWWHNVRTDRGKTLSGWEKKLPQYSKAFKKETSAMISRSESYLGTLFLALKKLASYRNVRELEKYLMEAAKLKSKYNAYNASFIDFYNGRAKKLIDHEKAKTLAKEQELADAELASQVEGPLTTQPPPLPAGSSGPDSGDTTQRIPSGPLGNIRDPFRGPVSQFEGAPTVPAPAPLNLVNPQIPAPPRLPQDIINEMVTQMPQAPGETVTIPAPPKPLPSTLPPTAYKHAPPMADPPAPIPAALRNTLLSPGNKGKKKKASYEEFTVKLASLENEHPLVIASEIVRYANSIAHEDFELSEKLLNIARNIVK